MTPTELLESLLAAAVATLDDRSVVGAANRERLEFVCAYQSNRAGVRLLMSCLLAKLHRPDVDPRKPYTEIGTPDCFSGRTYDEKYLTAFIQRHRLPCNSTTAFLTPVLRNIAQPLTADVALIGKPKRLYADAVQLLEDVAAGRESADSVLTDILRLLLRLRNERLESLDRIRARLRRDADDIPLASERIVSLVVKHLGDQNTSRLPVLIVAAAYDAAGGQLGEVHKPLYGHNAADKQTGAVGDVEITLVNDDRVCTVYEMKQKAVHSNDIDAATVKVAGKSDRVDNYIFITTEPVDPAVAAYAASLYDETGGTEFAILDCVGFLRHYLHLFHRRRTAFLDAYQALVLSEPDSAVGLSLKELFLSLRQKAEADE